MTKKFFKYFKKVIYDLSVNITITEIKMPLEFHLVFQKKNN